jgi:hypothetical protein
MADLRRLAPTCADLRRLAPTKKFFFSATDQSCCVFWIHSRAYINPDRSKIILSLYLDPTETIKGG